MLLGLGRILEYAREVPVDALRIDFSPSEMPQFAVFSKLDVKEFGQLIYVLSNM